MPRLKSRVQIPSPAPNAYACGNNSAVECQLPKLDVAGSNPVSRSRYIQGFRVFAREPFFFPHTSTTLYDVIVRCLSCRLQSRFVELGLQRTVYTRPHTDFPFSLESHKGRDLNWPAATRLTSLRGTNHCDVEYSFIGISTIVRASFELLYDAATCVTWVSLDAWASQSAGERL